MQDEGGDVLAKGLRVLAAVRVEPLVDLVGPATKTETGKSDCMNMQTKALQAPGTLMAPHSGRALGCGVP